MMKKCKKAIERSSDYIYIYFYFLEVYYKEMESNSDISHISS